MRSLSTLSTDTDTIDLLVIILDKPINAGGVSYVCHVVVVSLEKRRDIQPLCKLASYCMNTLRCTYEG